MKKTHQEMKPLQAPGYIDMSNLVKRSEGKKTLRISTLELERMIKAYEDLVDIIAYNETKKNQKRV